MASNVLRRTFFSSSLPRSMGRNTNLALQETRRANRAARKAALKSSNPSSSQNTSASAQTRSTASVFLPRVLGGTAVAGSALLFWGIMSPEQDSIPSQISRTVGLTDLWNKLAEPWTAPHRDELLPSWPMPNVPQDLPCPHTLVVDLEGTLVNSSWDRKYGWRHAKRPGVDKFLRELGQYYEIVLFSPSLMGVAEPVVASLDKNGYIMHHLFREATRFINGSHVKDISMLNRNVNRIIVIDDDPREVQLHQQNLLRVKPYDDPTDREDKTLENIIPMLIEIAKENHKDIPMLLNQFRRENGERMDAEEIANEYQNRIDALRNRSHEQNMRGLGRFQKVGGIQKNATDYARDMNAPATSSKGLSAKDIVGSEPPRDWDEDQKSKKTGRLTDWYNRRQEAMAEEKRVREEKWQEVMEKMAKERQEREKKAN